MENVFEMFLLIYGCLSRVYTDMVQASWQNSFRKADSRGGPVGPSLCNKESIFEFLGKYNKKMHISFL